MSFTDPGLADTQSAVIYWGDGTPPDTSFGAFSDAHNGAIGVLEDAHAFSAPGTYQIVAAITDDDGDTSIKHFSVTVVSLEDAIERVVDRLTELIAATTDASLAAALRAARDELIGNHAGTPPTYVAVDKLEERSTKSPRQKNQGGDLEARHGGVGRGRQPVGSQGLCTGSSPRVSRRLNTTRRRQRFRPRAPDRRKPWPRSPRPSREDISNSALARI